MSPDAKTLVVTKQLDLAAPLATVWEAIADPDQIGRWFADRVEVEAMTPGSTGWFFWEKHGRYPFEVLEMDPPRHLVWRWTHEPGHPVDAFPTTRVEWTLEPLPSGGTRLTMRESGFPTELRRRENDQGWDEELGELVALLTG